MNENSEKKITFPLLISNETNAPPRDRAALDRSSVFANVNSHGSGQ